jgi:hypothetical protein
MILSDDYKIKYINKFLDVEDLGVTKRDGNINCIFHDDNKASARCYSNNAFWCFTCNRFFYPINIIRKKHLNIDDIFDMLYEKFGHHQFKFEEKDDKKEIKIDGKNIVDFTKEYFGINLLNKDD